MGLPRIVRIKEIRKETRTTRTFVLDAEAAGAEPGQFVMLWLPDVDEKPISIARPVPLTLTIARVGPFSTALHQREANDRVGWRGPYGNGFALHEDRSALIVAGGYGAAPLYFLAMRAVEHGVPTTVVLGAYTSLDLLYVEQFRKLDVELVLSTDDGTFGHKGYVTDAIVQSEICHPRSAIYACGPEPMLVALHRLCQKRGIPGQFSVERYMKCGFGICGQCALDGLLVCQDGPVFNVEQLEGLHDFGQAQRSATGRRLPIR